VLYKILNYIKCTLNTYFSYFYFNYYTTREFEAVNFAAVAQEERDWATRLWIRWCRPNQGWVQFLYCVIV